jgi:hypothetical protein
MVPEELEYRLEQPPPKTKGIINTHFKSNLHKYRRYYPPPKTKKPLLE